MRPNLITRLKEEWNSLDPVDPLRGLIADAIDALAEQPANQVDDINVADIPKIGCANHDCDKCKAQQQEPVAVYVGETWCGSVVRLYEDLPLETPLYTSPQPSKPWVGLSTVELDEIDAPIRERGHATVAEIYRAIEAKLREKNA